MRVKPQVSCIVPAYNAEKYLKQALDSVLVQSGVELEVIVVDDGSTDDTAAIAAACGEKVQVISQANCGQAVARNRGIAAANGEYLAFLDADDLWSRDKLEKQLAAFTENPALELCAAHTQNFEAELKPVGEAVPGYTTEILMRRTLFDRVGPFAAGLLHAGALEWMLRARQAKVVEQLLPDTLSYRRLHPQNMSVLGANESLKEHLAVLHASLKQRKLT